MAVHTGTNPTTLHRLDADIAQLTRRIHTAIRGRIVTHPALLDALRDAAVPATSGPPGPERRSIPASRPPARLDGVEALAEVYTEISAWHARLHLPSPPEWIHGCPHLTCRHILIAHGHPRAGRGPTCPAARLRRADWHKSVLHQLANTAPAIASSMAEWLAVEVNDWWRTAATAAGWRATDLLKLR